MKFLVVDTAYKNGKERNIMFATSNRQKAIRVSRESGLGVSVIEISDNAGSDIVKNEKIEGDTKENKPVVFVFDYKSDISLTQVNLCHNAQCTDEATRGLKAVLTGKWLVVFNNS
jgi:hypothetical protein